MRTSKKGIDLIKKYEGCRLKAYKCPAGVWTIGYGHTSGVKKGQVISQAQAEGFLKQDLEKFERGIMEYVKVQINQNQFDALVSFTFNVGLGAFNKSTLLRLLNVNKITAAAAEFDRWVYAAGVKLDGLIERRNEEKKLFLENLELKEVKNVKVTATALNVRAGAGTNYNITGILYKNSIVSLSDTSNGWGKLSDGKGWICLKYVSSL